FFQAEDGIRDFHVTGVQTCALPICRSSHSYSEKLECRHCHNIAPMRVVGDVADTTVEHLAGSPPIEHGTIYEVLSCPKCEQVTRSEERRVGKESGSRRTAQHERRHL